MAHRASDDAEPSGNRITQIILALIAASATILGAYWQFGRSQGSKQEESEKNQTFSGRVSDSSTGRRLRGAKVSLEAKGVPPILYTDSEGIFTFPLNNGSGNMHIMVDADGYESYDRRIDLNKTSGVEDIRLDLIKPASDVKPSRDSTEPNNSSRLQQLRVKKALEATESNLRVDSDLNSLVSAFENLFKGRLQVIDTEREKPLIAEIYSLHNTFNRDAWLWPQDLVQQVELLHLLDQDEIEYGRNLAECYDRTLKAGVRPLEPFWVLLEGPATKSPPQELSELIRYTREKLNSSSQDRASIVSALTKLVERSDASAAYNFRCKYDKSLHLVP